MAQLIQIDRCYILHDENVAGKLEPKHFIQVYYFKKKKSKAKAHYHTVYPDETLWSISQKYGVRVSKLLNKNRLDSEDDIQLGMVLWLRYIRPDNEPLPLTSSF